MPQQAAMPPVRRDRDVEHPAAGEEARPEIGQVRVRAVRLGREAVFREHAEDELARRLGVRPGGAADCRALESGRRAGGADSRPVRRSAKA